MLSQLDGTQATNADASAEAAGNATSTNFAAPEPDASTALTGTDQSRLSDQILALLVQLQQQTQTDGSQTASANNSAAPGSGSTTGAPVHALFSAMDSNGDGIVTEAEMETYIQQQGGTQSQADKLFATLTQNGSSGISENQLASDVAQGQKAHHRHHHHHDAADTPPSSSGGTSSTDLASQASQIFGGFDSNQDGTLSAAELTSAGLGVTDPALSAASNGTSSSNAPNSLASLDSNGDGSVSANEFATFFASLELQIQSDTATMANLLQASQAYGSAAGSSSPPSVVQSA
jgi:Ca2+-binding EF-hand superfamily protein